MTNNEVIQQITEEFAQELITDLQAAAQKVGKDTGSGQQSFDADVLKGLSSSAAVVITQFQSHMRLYDMRKVVRTSGLDPRGISAIKEWIERKGVSSFLKGYTQKTEVRQKGGAFVPVPITRIINNIAWGISRKKKPLKRKKWYNQKKGSSIYALYAKLVDGVIENSLKEAKETYTSS
jgi:hypothetical protein